MSNLRKCGLLASIATFIALGLPMQSLAQSDTKRLDELEQRIERLEQHPRGGDAAGVAAFVSGAFCALWAQRTRRNAWLWFFLGLFFNVITLVVLLYKNSHDKREQVTQLP